MKTPIIIEGARMVRGNVENLNTMKYITTVLEHKFCID